MGKLMNLFVMTLLVGCVCQNEIDKVIIDNGVMNTLDEVTVCIGREKECHETLAEAMEQIPAELQNTLVDTIERIEIVVDNQQGFMHYMDNEVGEIKGYDFVGIAMYGYTPKTLVYSMADDYVLTHELGHVYDYSFKYKNEIMPSSTEEWQWAWKNEYISSYGTTSAMEFYAECFSMYFRYPRGLKMSCPTAYELMEAEFGHME